MDGWLRTMTHPGSLDVEMASPGCLEGTWTCLAGEPGTTPLQCNLVCQIWEHGRPACWAALISPKPEALGGAAKVTVTVAMTATVTVSGTNGHPKGQLDVLRDAYRS